MYIDPVDGGAFGICGSLAGSFDDRAAFSIGQWAARNCRNIMIGIP